MSDDTYELYAVRFGHFEARSPMNFLGGDPHDVPQPLAYYVWAIVGKDKTFIVDSGFDEARSKTRNRQIINPVGKGLKAIGIDPDKVSNVIVSHMHYDHAGNHGLFPNARYHIQDCEMQFVSGRCMCHALMRLPFEYDDVTTMLRRVYDGRVEFHDGDGQVAPGITVHKIGGHSKGLQCVRVKTRRGHVVLASDSSHFYAHMEQSRVFPVLYNVEEVLEGYKTLRRLADSPNHIIPGHDPLVLSRYQPARDGLEDWVVRLDVEPKA